MGQLEITAELQSRGPAAAFVLDEEQVAAIGDGARRFPARAEINGTVLRTTVTRMRGEFLFGLSKAARAQAGATIGETYTFTLALDTEPREVDVPPALAAALSADPEAQRAYDALSYTDRKEYARWVADAKRDDTRNRRVAETLTRLRG